MAEVSNPIESTVGDKPPSLPLNRNTYIIGGLVLVGALVMFTRAKSTPTNAASQPTAEPNTNVLLGSVQQMIADYGGRNSQAIAQTQQQIESAKADITGSIGTGAKAADLGNYYFGFMDSISAGARDAGLTQAQYIAKYPYLTGMIASSQKAYLDAQANLAHFPESASGQSVAA